MYTAAKRVHIQLFEGERDVVQNEVNTYLASLPGETGLAGVQYNYQGAEWGKDDDPDARAHLHEWVRVARPTHGILVITVSEGT